MAHDSGALDPSKLSVVYTLPGMEAVRVRKNLPYLRGAEPVDDTDDGVRYADLYYPPDMAEGERRPAVIFISGDADPQMMRHAKDVPQYTDWGRLVAASDMIAVTFDHDSTRRFERLAEVEGQVSALLEWVRAEGPALGIDADRIGIWVCSGGPPFGLRAVWSSTLFTSMRAVAVFYGMLNLEQLLDTSDQPEVATRLREYSPLLYLGHDPRPWPPMLVARAGQDHVLLNASIDAFTGEALGRNACYEVMNHPTGRHAFDVLDPDLRSREIIQRTLTFLAEHVLSSLNPPEEP